MRAATRLVALTDAEVASYRALGVETPSVVIPNGVDVSAYRTEPRGDYVGRLGIADDRLVVLFLGRIHPIKGADRLLDAFARICADHPSAVLVMAGPDEWALEAGFRARTAAPDLAGRVVFTGMVSGADKLDLLARADLFCLPSDAEGFSVAVLEALASGTPVLLSPGCHFPAVEAQGCGRVVDSAPDALAPALRELLADRAALREMGERGRAFVSRDYSWETITDRTLDAYLEAIGRGRHAAGVGAGPTEPPSARGSGS
jgi:glycosyltransferase involved in cell wall biosynthesis